MLPSLHFIPSHRDTFYERLNEIPATSFVFDLEDGVPGNLKSRGRTLLNENRKVIESLNSFLRLNRQGNGFLDEDLKLLDEIGFNGLVIPKIESPEEIKQIRHQVIERKKGNHEIIIIGLIESFKGLETIEDIVEAGENNLMAFGFGLEDLLSTIPILEIDQKVIEYIQLKIISTCKANDLFCIDTVSLNYKDIEQFKQECLWSRSLLFDGKFSIHPTQVPVINDVYRPSDKEIGWAKSIMASVLGKTEVGYQKVGTSVISTPKVKKAQLILKKAEK